MIPAFDSNGNLPPSVHKATIDEIVERYGGPSLQRITLTKSLSSFLLFINNHANEIFLVGSYVSKKLAPNDVDILVILLEDFDWQGHEGEQLLKYLQDPNKHLHIFVCRYRDRRCFRDRIKLFSTTRDNPPLSKGMIKLELEQ